MRKLRNRKGFTMAEFLIVVAIVAVLSGIAYIALDSHHKNMAHVEADSIAKEIFVAAQNHMMSARGQNFLGIEDEVGGVNPAFGYHDSSDDDGVYYCAVNNGVVSPSSASDFFQMVLPFGSVDENVLHGNYVIRYQPASAVVMDVFYSPYNGKYAGTLGQSDYSSLLGMVGDDNRSARADYHGAIVGWYGGESASEIPNGAWLQTPYIEVVNADRLFVRIVDPNAGNSDEGVVLQLLVKGLDFDGNETGAMKAFDVERIYGVSEYTVVLDDIASSGNHFADIFGDTGVVGVFMPGQDLKIEAVAFNRLAISNIAYSDEEVTNSLFSKINRESEGFMTEGYLTAEVGNIRHLENLYGVISGINLTPSMGANIDSFNLAGAEQVSDIAWDDYCMHIAAASGVTSDSVQIYPYEGSEEPSEAGCFIPVSPEYPLIYDGCGYNVLNVKERYDGDAGLFGTLPGGSSVMNLSLLNFDVQSDSGNAGALAGTLSDASVMNVVSRNTRPVALVNVSASSGSAGGLIGEASGSSINNSAAALIVNGDTAGGLIGTLSSGEVVMSYSGGHTVDGVYRNDAYNVTGDGVAGGLIGVGTDVTNIAACYSTCSVSASTCGGFAGEMALRSDGHITDSYATGLVSSSETDTANIVLRGGSYGVSVPKAGAFAYSISGGTVSDCGYFEIINSFPNPVYGGYIDMSALGGNNSVSGIVPFDSDTESYADFVSMGDGRAEASVYDGRLVEYYGLPSQKTDIVSGVVSNVKAARYYFKTVKQLNGSDDGNEDFVNVHYGDWPVPEIFMYNTTA